MLQQFEIGDLVTDSIIGNYMGIVTEIYTSIIGQLFYKILWIHCICLHIQSNYVYYTSEPTGNIKKVQ